VNYPAGNGSHCKSVTIMHVRCPNELHLKPWAPTRFFPGVGNEGFEGWKSLSEIQGQNPSGGLGQSPQKPKTFAQNNACINT